jgi:hypothetical protein
VQSDRWLSTAMSYSALHLQQVLGHTVDMFVVFWVGVKWESRRSKSLVLATRER